MTRYVSMNPSSDDALANVDATRVPCVQARRVIVKVSSASLRMRMCLITPAQHATLGRKAISLACIRICVTATPAQRMDSAQQPHRSSALQSALHANYDSVAIGMQACTHPSRHCSLFTRASA